MAGAAKGAEFPEIQLLKLAEPVTGNIMRALVIIFGAVAALALVGFSATGSYRNAAICDTADCPAPECP
jgi:hypothetical protein